MLPGTMNPHAPLVDEMGNLGKASHTQHCTCSCCDPCCQGIPSAIDSSKAFIICFDSANQHHSHTSLKHNWRICCSYICSVHCSSGNGRAEIRKAIVSPTKPSYTLQASGPLSRMLGHAQGYVSQELPPVWISYQSIQQTRAWHQRLCKTDRSYAWSVYR